ncbi:hypothetical protein ES288_D12G049300v1 [Gossypium darwinii]|uniref:Embryogenesis-associated protein EMB8 isoform X2 n=4 Tax=Gossypium TaxID=3633 RepID=A0ABM3BB38_GOSHI|nr:embryogenesis-associated protein EMB8 isoform X2 [Gossypium hirsutum]TYG39863.1 hypothetical protein ES288_D12G049300v1 [Gossypium darwinii]
MDSGMLAANASPYDRLVQALALIPISYYLFAALFIFLAFLYTFLEIHFLHDLLTLFRGYPVTLTYNSSSHLCQSLLSNCNILRGRYSVTPWLSGPHLQTVFLSVFGRAPPVTYRRHLFLTSDGGTIALDWLTYSDVTEGRSRVIDDSAAIKRDKTPIMIVIPGLTSDSSSAYAKHLAFNMARNGWNVVVSNHRGLGGVSLTSDCFYNAGYTEDLRKLIDHIHCEYPEAPLFAVGASIGANILVKYLGEDGTNTPLVGAAAICSPWDLLICDRFINRKPVQKMYDRALTVGLKGISLSCLVLQTGKALQSPDLLETLTSMLLVFLESLRLWIHFIGVQAVLIMVNENIILATTPRGGHLAFYEGITASSLWWVRAVDEFFGVLRTSPLIKERQKKQGCSVAKPLQSSIDEGPYLDVMEDRLVTAMGNEASDASPENYLSNEHRVDSKQDEDINSDAENSGDSTAKLYPKKHTMQQAEQDVKKLIVLVQGHIDKLSRRSRQSIWLLAYIAIITTWPFVDSFLLSFLKRRFKNFIPASLLKNRSM